MKISGDHGYRTVPHHVITFWETLYETHLAFVTWFFRKIAWVGTPKSQTHVVARRKLRHVVYKMVFRNRYNSILQTLYLKKQKSITQ